MKSKQYCTWIKIHPACIVYFICVACFSSVKAALYSIVVLLIHEMGHLFAAIAMGERIGCIYLTPFGGMIRCERTSLKGVRGILIAAGGPLANLLCMILIGIPVIAERLSPNDGKILAAANLTMLALNCVPVLPLDGGRVLFSAGYYIWSISQLSTVLSVSGIAVGISMTILSFYGMIQLGKLNISLLIVGVWLIIEAQKEKNRILAENVYTVIEERKREQHEIRGMKAYRVLPKTRAIKLIDRISGSREAFFLVDCESGRYMLFEDDIQQLILLNPQNSIEDAVLTKANRTYPIQFTRYE